MRTTFHWFCILNLVLLPAACHDDDDGGNGNGDAGNARIISLKGVSPQAITSADLNNDGDPDIVVAYGNTNKVGVLLNDGGGDFDESLFDLDGGNRPEAMVVADLDGDGNQDVVTANEGSHTISVLLGRGDGRLRNAVSFGAGVTADRLITLTTGDLNNDGHLDVITLSDAAKLSVRLGNGDGTLQPTLVFDEVAEAENDHLALNLVVMDLNNNGDQDVITYNTSFHEGDGYMSSLNVMFGNGDGTLQAETQVVGSARLDKALQVMAADMNNDGQQDLLQAESQTPLLLNNGNGTFQRDEYNFCQAPNCRAAGVAVGDMDGDGRLDIATINNRIKTVCDPCDADRYGYNETLLGSQGVSILLGNGDGTLEETEINVSYNTDIAFGSGAFDDGQAIGSDGSDVIAADLDQDDEAEIIAIYGGNLAVFSLP